MAYDFLYNMDGTKLAVFQCCSLNYLKLSLPLPGGASAVYNWSGLQYYRHPDWLGTTRLATSPGRGVVYDGAVAPFGEAYAQTGNIQGYSFTGQEQEAALDLFDFAFREYHTTQGRWISPDPAGLGTVDPADPQTWNRYAYVRNNPLNTVDPWGLDPQDAGNGCTWDGSTGTLNCPGPGPIYTWGWWIYWGWRMQNGYFVPPSGGGGGARPAPKPQPAKTGTCYALAAGQAPSGTVGSWLSGTGTAASMTAEWALGIGPTNTDFGSNSVQSQEMMSAYGLASNVKAFLGGGASSGNQTFGLSGLGSTGLNPTGQFVGSYQWNMSRSGGNLNITLTNSTTAWSAFYHPKFLNPNPPTRSGWRPMGRVNQTFRITVPCS